MKTRLRNTDIRLIFQTIIRIFTAQAHPPYMRPDLFKYFIKFVRFAVPHCGTRCTPVFVLLCALTNFVAKTVDFVELMQGVVNLSLLRDKEYIPGIGIGALFLSLSSFLLFHIVHFPLKGKDFERTIRTS